MHVAKRNAVLKKKWSIRDAFKKQQTNVHISIKKSWIKNKILHCEISSKVRIYICTKKKTSSTDIYVHTCWDIERVIFIIVMVHQRVWE